MERIQSSIVSSINKTIASLNIWKDYVKIHNYLENNEIAWKSEILKGRYENASVAYMNCKNYLTCKSWWRSHGAIIFKGDILLSIRFSMFN